MFCQLPILDCSQRIYIYQCILVTSGAQHPMLRTVLGIGHSVFTLSWAQCVHGPIAGVMIS